MNNNKFSNFDKDLLVIHLKKKLSIEGVPLGRKVINHYLKEIQLGSPTLIKGMVDTVIHEIERVSSNYKNHSQELYQLKDENNFLRRELNRLKKSKAKPKTYKYMVRNSLGNANFNVDKLASYLDSSSVSNLVIDEFLNTATQQLINLIHTFGARYGK